MQSHVFSRGVKCTASRSCHIVPMSESGGTERACSDMPTKEGLRLLRSGVLKYIDYWIPGLLGGFWDALPMDEAHAVCPCSEHESSGDPKEDCELGMKQWALQHGGPTDSPPDALW